MEDNKSLRRRIEKLERSRRDDDFDEDDLEGLDPADMAGDEPSGRGYIAPQRLQQHDPYARGPVTPHGGRRLGSLGRHPREAIAEYRRYRRDTTPARVSSGLGMAPGAIFGADVARYAMASKDSAHLKPEDRARATVHRYRSARQVSR
jgi:hypothetical protein